MKVSLAKVFEMIDFEAQVEPYLNNAARQFVSVNRLKERLVTIDGDACWKDCEHVKLKGLQGSASLIRTLKDDLQRHINTIGITNPSEYNEEGEKPFCDCADENICEKKREAIAKLIKVVE